MTLFSAPVTVALNNGAKLNKVSTTCQVFAPQANIQVDQGTTEVYADQTGSWLGLGPANGFAYGIGWHTTVSTPPGNGFAQGEFNYLQLVKAARTRAFNNVAQHDNLNGMWMLDGNLNPYPPAVDPNTKAPFTPFNAPNGAKAWMTDGGPGFALDAPALPWGVGGVSAVTASDYFNTYVMYLPPGTGSQWVPLQMEEWSYAAVADSTTGVLTYNAKSSWQSIPAYKAVPTEPTWTQPTIVGAWVNN